MIIALAGNPNSGKTTTFNLLTGKLEKIGNWAGVTVEKKMGKLKKQFTTEDISVLDLPGVYSLDVYTDEEKVTKSALEDPSIDVIINIVDTTNLERGLSLTTQLLKSNKKIILALNKHDLARKKGIDINTQKLEEVLGIPVLLFSAAKKEGIEALVSKAINLGRK